MINKSYSFVVILSIISSFAVIANDTVDQLINRPELALPISNKKLVIAHNMTNIIRYKGHELEDSCDPEYYSSKGNITEKLGGLVQVIPLISDYLKDASLEEAVEFEMRAAKKCGIDGFQFYYTLRKRGPDDEIIKAFFRVAEREKIDFKFTFCPSHPSGLNEDLKIKEFSARMNAIFAEVGHDNPHWLRTPDGRLIMYLWYGEQIADIPVEKTKPEAFYVARAWDKLAKAIGEDVAYVFSINHEISKVDLEDYLDYFPATWIWTIPYTENYLGKRVAEACREKNRNFTGSTFGSFYTSKLLARGTWDMYHYARQAADAGIDNVERKGIVTGLSYNYRKLLEFAIDQDVSIINLITWNDYPEGHHLGPEINNNYGFSVLLNYYKSLWKHEPSPFADRDVAVTFFKKYRHNIRPDPFDIPLTNIAQAVPESEEDVIEVVSILPTAATIGVNGEFIHANEGITSNHFTHNPGSVDVSVSRNGIETLRFECPEWITGKPYRTDRLTYTFSSEFEHFHQYIFGDYPALYSTEYRPKDKPFIPLKSIKE